MSFITLVENDCKSCLKCVRSCPTKSITFKRNRPVIIEEECIQCGQCYLCCPQSAKKIQNDLPKVKQWLNEKQEVVLSVAPSYQVIWPNYSKLKQGLLELGFKAVEETAQGARVVSGVYGDLMQQKEMTNIIETCCPVITRLIETKYPSLISMLSPVASPMIVHGRMLREKYPNAKIVFLSPCIAKQHESLDERFKDAIDAVIPMPDMDEWLMDADLYEPLDHEEENIARIYPVSGGIIKTIDNFNGYKSIAVEGLKRVEAVLSSIANGHLKGYFFELNACEGGCLGGPYLLAYKDNEWLAQSRISAHEDSSKIKACKPDIHVKAEYKDDSIEHPHFSEIDIYRVLVSMGKADRSKRLDCGACGYDTCRNKAIAVLEGKSDPMHCLPFALESAQSMSNMIIKHSPNGIIVIDEKHKIREINPSAIRMLSLQSYSVKGFEVEAILPSQQFKDIFNEGFNGEVKYFVDEYLDGEKVYEHAVFAVEEESSFVIIMMDLTQKMKQEERLRKLRKDTIDSTQRVIDKQMRVVQEIASLLGETTAETKVVLTKLNHVFDGDE